MSKITDDRNRTDEDIVRRCRDGDVEAFGILVERHQKKVFNIAFRMTGDDSEACDISQDAFLAAYRAIGTFRGEARFSTWLYGITLNVARTRLKQAIRRRQTILPLDDPPEDGGGQSARVPPSGEASAIEKLESREIQARVQHCIGTLDEDHMGVLVLRDIQGLSYEEMREAFGVPEGTIKSRLFRAREAMKNCLKPWLGDL